MINEKSCDIIVTEWFDKENECAHVFFTQDYLARHHGDDEIKSWIFDARAEKLKYARLYSGVCMVDGVCCKITL